jgi:hypothetical protein
MLTASWTSFGHSVVSSCDYCLSFDDFGMFALPRVLISYIFAAAVIGVSSLSNPVVTRTKRIMQLVTITSSGRERYRTLAVAAVAGAFCVEAYYITTVTINIPQDDKPVFMVRHTLSLISVFPTDFTCSGTTPCTSSGACSS